MAVVLYKEGSSRRVDPYSVQCWLDRGWSYKRAEVQGPAPVEPLSLDPPVEQAVSDPPSELSNKEVRRMAKEAGISGWDTARIKTLKAAIDDPES